MTSTLAVSPTQVESGDHAAEVLISVEQLSKKFCRSLKRSLFYGVSDIMTELVAARRRGDRLRKGEFWALKDVDFKIYRGQSLGLVGPNGAGKSTLLRIISGVIKPDTGVVRVNARVAPLIALGAGFSPVLTGRENVFVNMSILGVSRKRIEKRFEEVTDFAGIGDAIDAPVQTYSSGMLARLGFSCAVFADADILLIDEVLAVGDLKFRTKCYSQLAKLRENGTSFVLVSHNAHSISSICDSAIYLSKGELVMADKPRLVISRYEQDLLHTEPEEHIMPMSSSKGQLKHADLRITEVYFQDSEGNRLESPATGSTVSLCVACEVGKELDGIDLIVAISNLSADNQRVLHLSSQYDGRTMRLQPGKTAIQLRMPSFGLLSGWYNAKLVVIQSSIRIFDVVESFRFRVRSDEHAEENLFYQARSWRAVNLEQEIGLNVSR
jgi:lipopolysaccharide transport system ATP-binding protein